MYINRNPEYFLTIAREGNFTRAAERLYVTQSSLSQHIAKLEHDLGTQLFDRSQSPMKLTPAGRIYLEYLENHSHLYNRMLSALHTNDRQQINLGVGIWRGAILLPHVLPQFLSDYPNAEIRLEELPQITELLPALLNGWIDFAVRNTSLEGLPNTIVSETIMNERIMLVLSRKHPLAEEFSKCAANGEPIDLHRLEGERYIAREADSPLGRHISNFLVKNHLAFKQSLTTFNNNTALRLSAAGAGFCFLLETGLSNAESDNIACFDLHSPDLTLPLSFLYKADTYLSSYTRELMGRIRNYYRSYPDPETKSL